METNKQAYGGEVIGRALHEGGVDTLFGVHGVINTAIEEAQKLGVDMYHFRHEQSAGFAADAYARCKRQPGVCFASTAPGFTNYVSPIAQAKSVQSPVVLLIGQHGVTGDGVNTIQEGYGTEVFRTCAKWTHRCLDWNMHSHWVHRALRESVSYPPGPVVLEFPRDQLNAKGPDSQLKHTTRNNNLKTSRPFGDPDEVARVAEMLIKAERPLLIAGDGVYWSQGEQALLELAERLNIPVSSRRTARGAVPEDHPLAFSGGFRGELLRSADVICIVGLRASYLEEWFEPPEWNHDATYIQIQERADEIWYGLPTEIAIVGACGPVLSQMNSHVKSSRTPVKSRTDWTNKVTELRQKFKDRQKANIQKYANSKLIHPHSLGASIAEVLDPSATIIFDSFTGTSYLTDKLESQFAGQILDAGLHQPVGHGIGMCVGAQVARPGQQVMTLIGDGGFGISSMDVETLVRYNLPSVIVLLNNNSWAGVAAGHDLFFPDMGSWDNSKGTRYDRMFKELGCHTENVVNVEDLTPSLDRAFNSGKTALVNVVCDTNDIHPLRTRVAFGDVWSRGNVDTLSEEARAQLSRVSSPRELNRVRKFWRDNGVDIPLEELKLIGRAKW